MAGAWDVVAGALGFGGPSGNDHGSSNWAAWSHEDICSMLDTSVDPGDIGDAAMVWRQQGRNTEDVLTTFTRDLNRIVSGGWHGAAADAAITALAPIDQWSASQAETAEQTTRLMAASGSSTAQAKAAVPPAKPMNWGEALGSFAVAGPAGGLIDAVAQEQARSEAHAEAVQIMTTIYSAPINDHRAAVPTYPQLADPTVQPPQQPSDQASNAGPAAGSGYPAGGGSGAGSSAPGGGHVAHLLSAPTALQSVAGSVPILPSGGQVMPDRSVQGSRHGAGQVAAAASAAAAAGVPIMAPSAASDARRDAGGGRLGGGRTGGYPGGGQSGGRVGAGHPGGRAGAGHPGEFASRPSGYPAEFGPRPSAAAAEVSEGRLGGLGRGTTATAAGRLGAGELMAPMGAVTGKGDEGSEHRRPSYLIEMDDIFRQTKQVS